MTPARFLQDWLEGWNGHDLDVIMRHYAETATFQSPSVLVLLTDRLARLRASERGKPEEEAGSAERCASGFPPLSILVRWTPASPRSTIR